MEFAQGFVSKHNQVKVTESGEDQNYFKSAHQICTPLINCESQLKTW